MALLTWPIAAQRLSNVKLDLAGNVVVVRFTVGKGIDCGGFKVLHGVDSANFAVVADEPGICGKLSEDETKTVTHQNPALGKKNFYRVQLYTLELSEIYTIDLQGRTLADWLVYPSPASGASGSLMLRWSKVDGADTWLGGIYDAQGKQVRSLKLKYEQPEQEIARTEGLEPGIYKLWLNAGSIQVDINFLVN